MIHLRVAIFINKTSQSSVPQQASLSGPWIPLAKTIHQITGNESCRLALICAGGQQMFRALQCHSRKQSNSSAMTVHVVIFFFNILYKGCSPFDSIRKCL